VLFAVAALVIFLAGAEPAFAADGGGVATWLSHYMAPIMFVSLVVLLLLGYPVAFALAANGLIYAIIGIELGLFQPSFLQALPERVYGTINNDVLLAIPFFTFMGLILERSGMAEDLLDTIGQLFGPVRGGVAYAVIFVGALLAATTGVVAASVISMGLISLPIMLRYGYDRRVASGVIAASGTLAQIIPPSLVLIVMADQLGRSVGDMYAGAFIPGIVLAMLYAGYIFLLTLIRPQYVPALPVEARTLGRGATSLAVALLIAILVAFGPGAFFQLAGIMHHPSSELANRISDAHPLFGGLQREFAGHVQKGSEPIIAALIGFLLIYAVALINKAFHLNILSRLAQETLLVLMPPLGLIFLVLGTIFIGIATPTEGGAMGAAGAMIIAFAKRRLTFDLTRQAVDSTAKLSAFVMFILLGARVFSLTFYGVNGHKWVEEMLVSLPGGSTGFLIFVNAFIFVLAFFLDFFELAFIVIPLLGPAAERLGIDLIWFGVVLGVNMQTSFMHPPFGFALFYLRSVAPRERYTDKITGKRMDPITTGQIYWGAIPFVVIQVIMIGLVILFPQMVMVYKGHQVKIDSGKVEDTLKNLTLPGFGGAGDNGSGGLPGFSTPGFNPPGLNPPKP
jgi:TRAP-type mannitol/chloroaromatic compound transport system permease large subunit